MSSHRMLATRIPGVRRLARSLLPEALRERLGVRIFLFEERLRDAVLDLRDVLGWSPAPPLPPAALRGAVGRTPTRREFLEAGTAGAREIAGLFEAVREPGERYPTWLDFGCGCGRIARHLLERPDVERLVGADVDARAVAWSARHLDRGRFFTISPRPPMELADGSVDLVYAASVFTHMDEAEQFEWLAELARLLRPGGLLVASTHGPRVLDVCPHLRGRVLPALAAGGIAFVRGSGAFNDHTTFHERSYLEREWSRFFELRAFRESVLFELHDLSAWRLHSE